MLNNVEAFWYVVVSNTIFALIVVVSPVLKSYSPFDTVPFKIFFNCVSDISFGIDPEKPIFAATVAAGVAPQSFNE